MLYVFIGLLNVFPAVIEHSDTVYWCKQRKLSWEDFRWIEDKPSGALSSNHVYVETLINIGQHPMNQDTVYWCKERTLRWSDFKWDENQSTGAASSCNLSVTINRHGDEFKFNISSFFYRKESWTNDSSFALLEHEQIHFDIAELTARRIRKFLSQQKVTIENRDEIIKTINVMMGFQKSTNKKFDEETYHGFLENKQNQWKVFVRTSLEELRAYDSKCRELP